MDAIPWDKTVALLTPDTAGDLRVSRHEMTLRAAVDRFAAMPREEQDLSGIGVHEPYLRVLNGRPAALGFLNADAVRQLIDTTR